MPAITDNSNAGPLGEGDMVCMQMHRVTVIGDCSQNCDQGRSNCECADKKVFQRVAGFNWGLVLSVSASIASVVAAITLIHWSVS